MPDEDCLPIRLGPWLARHDPPDTEEDEPPDEAED